MITKLSIIRATRGLTLGAGFLGATFFLLGVVSLVISYWVSVPLIHPLIAPPFIIMGIGFMVLQKVSDDRNLVKWSMDQDLVFRLRKRAEIRRQIITRKSVQNNERDRIADLLEEAADDIEKWRGTF